MLTQPSRSTAPAARSVSTLCLWRNRFTFPSSPRRYTPWFFPVSTSSEKLTTAAPVPSHSICAGSKSSRTSPASSSIPSGMRSATGPIATIDSSNKVLHLSPGSARGTGLKSLPSAEYCGTRRLSPPLWITRIRFPANPMPFSFSSFSADSVAPPEPTRIPPSSGITKNCVPFGRKALLLSICSRNSSAWCSLLAVRITASQKGAAETAPSISLIHLTHTLPPASAPITSHNEGEHNLRRRFSESSGHRNCLKIIPDCGSA